MADPTRLGTVEDVTGSKVTVKLSDDTAHGILFARGEGYRVGQVGSFVRIPAGYVDLFGIVAQVGAGAAPPLPDQSIVLGSRWLRIELVGEGRHGGKFERGISQYPSIGDSVHVVTERDLKSVYAPGDIESHVAIGRVASSEGIRAYINLNKLVSRHSAVVGSTGSGKSTSVASLLTSVSDETKFPSARVVLLDLHGEYVTAFGDRARVFRINADVQKGEQELYVPFWALNAEEVVSFSMGASAGNQLSAVTDRLVSLKNQAKPSNAAHNVPAGSLTADTPLPFCIHKLWYDLHCLHYGTHTVSNNQNQSEATRAWQTDPDTATEQRGDALSVRRPLFRPLKDVKDDPDKIYKSTHADQAKAHIEALETKLRDPRLQFLFNPGDWAVSEDGSTTADLDTLLSSWIGADKPISVFDLSGIPSLILDDLVGAMLRILYDAAFWGRFIPEGGRHRPLLIVLEEAHNYLGSLSKGRASVAARRIAKEGRKYGVGLMLVSQRPSEIDPTILSQCGTTISLRLTNDADQSQVRSCASDNLDGLFGMLPSLRTGEALLVGEAVSMPVRALIDLPPEGCRPDSEDPLVVVPRKPSGERKQEGGWTDAIGAEDYGHLIEAWRKQTSNKEKQDAPAV